MHLLTNKVLSKLILCENWRIKLFLNRELEWELSGWKLIILRAFFVNWHDDQLHYNSETNQVSSN